jgi:hypothetical protein
MPALQSVRVPDRTAGYAGVVHQDVQPPISRHRFGYQSDPLRLAGDVDLRSRGLSVTGANGGGHGFGIASQDIGDNDLGALRREQPRLGFTHAMGAAGDDRNFVLQTHDRASFAWVMSISVPDRCLLCAFRRHD